MSWWGKERKSTTGGRWAPEKEKMNKSTDHWAKKTFEVENKSLSKQLEQVQAGLLIAFRFKKSVYRQFSIHLSPLKGSQDGQSGGRDYQSIMIFCSVAEYSGCVVVLHFDRNILFADQLQPPTQTNKMKHFSLLRLTSVGTLDQVGLPSNAALCLG